jgi:hypothetical protein
MPMASRITSAMCSSLWELVCAPLFNVDGERLNLTWGQWHKAEATSTAHASGKRSDVRIQLSGLVSGRIYSIFYVNLSPDS